MLKILKAKLRVWLDIPDKVCLPEPRQGNETLRRQTRDILVDILEGCEPLVSELTGFTPSGMCSYRLVDSKPFQAALDAAVLRLSKAALEEHARTHLRPWIESEAFLDSIVERLRRKQLPCSGPTS